MIKGKIIKGQKLVFVPTIGNYVMINILDIEIVSKYKTEPQKILAVGLFDLYNVTHRVAKCAISNKVPDNTVKEFTELTLNFIVAQIMKASVEFEAGVPLEEIGTPVEFKITEKDEQFLKDLKIDSRSLKCQIQK